MKIGDTLQLVMAGENVGKSLLMFYDLEEKAVVIPHWGYFFVDVDYEKVYSNED